MKFVHIASLTPAEIEELKASLIRDSHGFGWPKMILKSDEGSICGAIGPSVFHWLWFSINDPNKLRTLKALEFLESYESLQGRKTVILPIAKSSPFVAYADKLGYKEISSNISLYEKVL